jgi:hypothetical protein
VRIGHDVPAHTRNKEPRGEARGSEIKAIREATFYTTFSLNACAMRIASRVPRGAWKLSTVVSNPSPKPNPAGAAAPVIAV